MTFQIDLEGLRSLFEDFYTLTGITMGLFDRSYQQIISYPEKGAPFCVHMRQNPVFLEKCNQSDCQAFQTCDQSKELLIYSCHAGLIEAAVPILKDGVTAGYLMFGQVTDNRSKQHILNNIAPYGEQSAQTLVKQIKYKSHRQIIAASKILDACTNYIILKEMLSYQPDDFFQRVNAYVDQHLQEDLSVNALCRQFHISRTRFYELLSSYTGGKIAQYIKEKRLQKAKELLKNTNYSVMKIAEQIGVNDYNYFCRIFKQHFGVSAKAYRKQYRS